MLYLLESFDSVSSSSSPLSEEGVAYGKKVKLRNNALEFDRCFSSYLLQDLSSAMIMCGDKIVIERFDELSSNDHESLFKFIDSIDLDNKKILIVASSDIINILKNKYENILIK